MYDGFMFLFFYIYTYFGSSQQKSKKQFLRISQHTPRTYISHQTLNQVLMKEVLSVGGLGMLWDIL